MKLKVNVLREHITKGVCQDPYGCAIALAFLDNKRVEKVYVEGQEVRVQWGGNLLYGDLPARARKFIAKFDDAEDVEDRKKLKPFSFNLNLA